MSVTNPSNSKLLSVVLGEDAWMGDANAIVTVDGVTVFNGAVTASEQGAGQTIALGAFDGSVDHAVSVQFTNDAYAGTSATDRNLYVKDVLVNGTSTGQSAALFSNGTANFDAPATALAANGLGSPTLLGSGPDTVQLSVSEDAWQGDAQFLVLLDGQQVGGVQTATASHAAGQHQMIDVAGSFGTGPHNVGVQFLNDAYGGSSSQDRNLYLDGVTVDGVDQGKSQALFSNGQATATVQAPISIGTGPDTISVVASEDAWQGDALMTISVDGTAVGAPIAVTASRAAGATELFDVHGTFGAGSHTVSVAFTNDAYGGTAATDRNLFVQSVTVDGTAVSGASGPLFSNGAVSGTATFGSATPPAATPPAAAAPPAAAPPAAAPPAPAPVVTAPAVTAPVVTTPAAPTPSSFGSTADVGLIPVGAPVYAANAPIETVGVGKEFSTIGAAVAAATDGTVILVDAGTYTNDFATNYAKVTLIAVGGRVNDVATTSPPNWKGLFTTENDLTLEGFNVDGVRIPDYYGHNGAGIRDDSGNLVLENDEFSDNQDGILTNAGNYSVTIDHSVFNDNGGNDGNGAGNIHNVYIGDIASVTATNSIFENAQVGHEFKSRANVNTITNNEFISGVGIGTGSYDIDLPNGGKDTVTDNTIIKGPNAENYALLHFGGEGIPYAGSSLTVSGNLFEAQNQPSAVAVLNQTSITAQVSGNEFANFASDSIAHGPAKLTSNYDGFDTILPNQSLVGVIPGSTYFANDALSHTLVLSENNYLAAQGGAGLLTIQDKQGHIIVVGGTGGIAFTETTGAGGNQISTVTGSTNLLDLTQGVGQDSIDSEGQDIILAGDGNQSAQLNGSATVTGGAGSDYWSVGGTASIDTGRGSAFINVAASATVSITGTNDYFALSSNGGIASWSTTNSDVNVSGSASVGAYSMQVYNGVVNMTTTAGASGVTAHFVTGDAHVISMGPDTIYAGNGNDTVVVSGAAQVYAGSGSLSVYGKGDGDGADVYGAGGDYTIGGDTGNITYHGGNLASTVEAILNNITIVGGTGRLTVNGGSRDVVTGGAGGLVFNDFGNGADVVTTQAGSSNVLKLSGIDTIQSYGNDTITLDSGNSMLSIWGNSSLVLEDCGAHVDLYGTDSVATVAGSDILSVHQGARLSLDASNADAIYDTDGTIVATYTDAATASASSAAVVGGSATLQTGSNGGIAVQAIGDAPTTISASGSVTLSAAGNTSIHLSTGSAYAGLGGTGNELWGGSGQLVVGDLGLPSAASTVHGGSGSLSIFAPNSVVTFFGGSGAAMLSGGEFKIIGGAGTINASASYGLHIDTFIGGSGSAYLSLDSHGSDVTFGTGQATIHELGWAGVNTFEFLAGMSGTESIENFRIGTDRAVLGTGVVVDSAVISNGSAEFNLSNGGHVTFAGLTTTQGVFG